jgi:putative heme-binding domain-containing protein
MYGNHAHPDAPLDPAAQSRDTREDFLLPPYYDPRGHAVNIRVPGGTIQRLSADLQHWSETVSGFRNAFDFDIDSVGEMFTFDSDMEWDVGLPWWRAVRVAHCIPGGDYGWRTGSYNMPNYFIGTLPPMDDVGRGSPVGTAFYEANAYPERFRGAFFMGDWSRGRIRVIFPKQAGGTYSGKTLDFIIGEPMNVTDLDVGPDGNLYFSIGGRGTNGGFYRVRYTGAVSAAPQGEGILKVLDQPMPRSAWGRKAILDAKAQMPSWEPELLAATLDGSLSTQRRLAAIECLQVHGPKPSLGILTTLAGDKDAAIRAQAAFLLGIHPLKDSRNALVALLGDESAFAARRACESLVRAGLDEGTRIVKNDPLVANLFALLDSPDRFVRYSAGLALRRVYRGEWKDLVLGDSIVKRPHGALEGLVQLIFSQRAAAHSDAIFAKLEEYSAAAMSDEILLDYLRTLQLAFIRDVVKDEDKSAVIDKIGPRLLAKFPNPDWRTNRELQATLAYMGVPSGTGALLATLTPDKTQEEQIHTVYCLRAFQRGWTPEQRQQLAAWFDRAWEMGGGASFEGHIEFLWQDTLKLMAPEERLAAEQHKADVFQKRQEATLAKQMAEDEKKKVGKSDLSAMSFQELSEYLEYDPGAYASANAEDIVKGREIFERAKCATCHVFGKVGRGGGPDLSTVVARFRRRDILEAIMFPSKVVSDQYVGVTLSMNDLSEVTGMIASENDQKISLITSLGDRMEINKSDIAERADAKGSIMPEGLLSTMSMDELVALINFLERGGDTN